MDTISRKHIAVAIVLLEGHIDLKMDLKRKMTHLMLDDDFQKRMIVSMELVKYPQCEWNDNSTLCNLLTYIFCMLVQMSQDINDCFVGLEQSMKKEKRQGILTNRDYLHHRRTNFELKRVIDRLVMNNDYNVTVHNESNIQIVYRHLEIIV